MYVGLCLVIGRFASLFACRPERVGARVPGPGAPCEQRVSTANHTDTHHTIGEVAASCDALDHVSALKVLSSALRERMPPSGTRTRSLTARAAVPRASHVRCALP